MAQGINSLIGSVAYQPAAGSDRDATELSTEAKSSMVSGLFTGSGTDGTEWLVGAIVLAALLTLILFRVGGFRAVIAS
jgi:hypothetical protein